MCPAAPHCNAAWVGATLGQLAPQTSGASLCQVSTYLCMASTCTSAVTCACARLVTPRLYTLVQVPLHKPVTTSCISPTSLGTIPLTCHGNAEIGRLQPAAQVTVLQRGRVRQPQRHLTELNVYAFYLASMCMYAKSTPIAMDATSDGMNQVHSVGGHTARVAGSTWA